MMDSGGPNRSKPFKGISYIHRGLERMLSFDFCTVNTDPYELTGLGYNNTLNIRTQFQPPLNLKLDSKRFLLARFYGIASEANM